MTYRYVVIGAGRQGTAAAYDLCRYGEATSVVIADHDQGLARAAAERVGELLAGAPVHTSVVDAREHACLVQLLHDADAVVSAVPYRFNLGVARAAVEAGASMCDLGGNTDIVWQELALDELAREAGVSIIPDCGLMPGMGNTLAAYGLTLIPDARHVRIYVGGLPRTPRPPFDYLLTFHIGGLSNEYADCATYLRQGAMVQVPVFTEREELQFPAPAGVCEAFVTSGGTSTCPWTFQDRLLTYEEKTVRYPGHCVAFKAFSDLGLLSLEPVEVDGKVIVPRDVFHTLLEPLITYPEDADIVVLRVLCSGNPEDRGHASARLELLDHADPATGFRAMERMTGFPAAIVAHMMASGRTPRGATPLELGVDGEVFVAEWQRRNLPLEVEVTQAAG